jgi:hypothetical protein
MAKTWVAEVPAVAGTSKKVRVPYTGPGLNSQGGYDPDMWTYQYKTVTTPGTPAVAGYWTGEAGGGKAGGGKAGGGKAGGGATQLPAYTPEAYKVNLPAIDWSFNPTGDQRTGWTNQATAQAGQEIDPQLQAIAQALQQYMTQGQNTRNELNPRYTNQSLGIANIVQNTVKQNAIDNAIRRGAENSGWLGSALDSAGQLEVEQRGALEAQRNQDLSAIAALEANQTQATGQQQTALEKLRGQRITTGQAQLENEAWAREQQMKESQFNSALGGEQLRASAYGQNASNQLAGYQTQVGAAMSDADRALQASIAANEQANAQWNQQYQMSTDAYNRARQGATPASVDNSKNYLIPGTIEWYRYNQINNNNTGGYDPNDPSTW